MSYYVCTPFVVSYKGYIYVKARGAKNLLKSTREIIHDQYKKERERDEKKST